MSDDQARIEPSRAVCSRCPGASIALRHVKLVERTRAAGATRLDVEPDDISVLFEQIAAIQLGDERRTRELRQRYLTVVLDGLRARPGTPLPGRPPRWEEISERWRGPLPDEAHPGRPAVRARS